MKYTKHNINKLKFRMSNEAMQMTGDIDTFLYTIKHIKGSEYIVTWGENEKVDYTLNEILSYLN